MGSCNWLLIFYSTKCLGRLLDWLRSPQVVARRVRRAQRRAARLGDVDGGRRVRAGDARREAAEAREERRLVARRRGHLDLDLVHLAGDDRLVAAGRGDPLAGPQVDGSQCRPLFVGAVADDERCLLYTSDAADE